MSNLILPKDKIISLDDCRLCGEGRKEMGSIGDRATVVYKSGKDPAIDWLVTLQKSNISDLGRGFTLMIMPIGHLTAFSDILSSRELAQNYGITFAIAHYGMQVVRQEEWKSEYGNFAPTAVNYGKCASAINTQEHFHVKAYTLDGGVNQPSPSDTEWIKREILSDSNGSKYVKALPVIKGELDEGRYHNLASRLVEICTSSYLSLGKEIPW